MKVVEKRLSLTSEENSPLDGIQKNQTQPFHVRAAQELKSRAEECR